MPLLIDCQYIIRFLASTNYEKAQQVVKFLKQNSKLNSFTMVYDAILKAKKGDKQSVLNDIKSMEQLSSSVYVSNVQYATIYAALGDIDKMYDQLEIGLSKRGAWLHRMMIYSVFIPYQNEPRFRDIWNKSWIPLDE